MSKESWCIPHVLQDKYASFQRKFQAVQSIVSAVMWSRKVWCHSRTRISRPLPMSWHSGNDTTCQVQPQRGGLLDKGFYKRTKVPYATAAEARKGRIAKFHHSARIRLCARAKNAKFRQNLHERLNCLFLHGSPASSLVLRG